MKVWLLWINKLSILSRNKSVASKQEVHKETNDLISEQDREDFNDNRLKSIGHSCETLTMNPVTHDLPSSQPITKGSASVLNENIVALLQEEQVSV